jgi:hypothetical protein
MAWQFARLRLVPHSPLHIGAGRRGMVALSRGFVPGHVLSNALAAAMGKQLGGQYDDFQTALEGVLKHTRMGPLLLKNPDGDALFYPDRDRHDIAYRYLTGSQHVTLDNRSGTAVDGALFEMEMISPHILRGDERGEDTQLQGGFWFNQDELFGQPLENWLKKLLLGGELKTGMGRLRDVFCDRGQQAYPHLRMSAEGLQAQLGDIIPGPTMSGVQYVPQIPWTGRLYDKKQGFGRRFSSPILVCMDGVAKQQQTFMPNGSQHANGCWQPVASD